MEKVWRLILDGLKEPHLNMAIDEAIMLSQREGESAPTLRIYKWLYPCISIGRFQNPLTLTLSPKGRGESEGSNYLPLVRRPTGGGVVLHDAFSFTYSIIYREDSGVLPKGVLNSYREIHLGILQGLKNLGIDATLHMPDNNQGLTHLKSCFSSPVKFDIVYKNRKIAGAAQRRKFGIVLQQGEVRIDLDVLPKWSYNNLKNAIITGLSSHLEAKFVEGCLSENAPEEVKI